MSNYTHDYAAEYLSLFNKNGSKRQISNAAVLQMIGAAPASHIDVHASDAVYGHVKAASTSPEPLGTAYVGDSDEYARADHVHPMPEISGSAETADFAKALKNPFMLYLEGAAVAEDRVDGVTDVHLRILKLDAQALEGLINLDNLPIGTESGTIAAGNHTHDYSNVYAALSHTHNYSSVYAALNHGHAITSLTLASAQSDLPGGNTTPATDSGWLFLASDNNAAYNEHPHWARLLPTHIYIADTTSGSGGHSVIINEKGEATLSSIAISQGTNPQVIGMLPSSVNNSDHITPFDLYDYASPVNHNHSGVYAPATHSHASSDISDLSTVLSTALSGYSKTGHSHSALSAGSGLKYASNGQTYTGTDERTLSVDVGANFDWTGVHSFPNTTKINLTGVLIGKGSSSAIGVVSTSTNRQFLCYNTTSPAGYKFLAITKNDIPNVESLNASPGAAGKILVSTGSSAYEWVDRGRYIKHSCIRLTSSTVVTLSDHVAGTDQMVYLIIEPTSISTTDFYIKVPSPSTSIAGDKIQFVAIYNPTSEENYIPIIHIVKNNSNDLFCGDRFYGQTGIENINFSSGQTLNLYCISYTVSSTTYTYWRPQKFSEISFDDSINN